MVGEGDEVSFGRDARVANPSTGLVERFSDGILKAVAAAHVANHREAGAVGSPVGPLDLLKHFARSASGERGAGQRAHAYPGTDGFAVQQHRHFGCGRDGHELGTAEAHGARLGGLGTRGEDVDGLALPGGAVEDGLSVGSEAGGANAAAAEGELTVDRRLWRCGGEEFFPRVEADGCG